MDRVTKGSWRTTAVGALAAVGLLITQVVALLDDNPATKLDPAVVMTALAALVGGFVARDDKVSSEDARAK